MNIFKRIKNLFHKDEEEIYVLTPKCIFAIALEQSGYSEKNAMELFDDKQFNNCWETFVCLMTEHGHLK